MLRILHLEDREEDSFLIQRALLDQKLEIQFRQVKNRADYLSALELGGFELILADSSVPGLDSFEALRLAREKHPDVPVFAVTGTVNEARAQAVLDAGAANLISKENLWQLAAAVRAEQERRALRQSQRGMARLVKAVQELSLARDIDAIRTVVRQAARELTGADGATFVLRDNEFCHYLDEDAIAPLWKGQKFPLATCISGWSMLHHQPVAIEDVFADPRIPIVAYRPTFVKSLAIVPIRAESPIGAIGNYWATQRMPTADEIELLQALANTTAVAMENVQVYRELEKRVQDRTAELEAANRELETFSYAVSHDLRAPLRTIRGFTEIVLKDTAGQLDEPSRVHLEKIGHAGKQMSGLIEDLLQLAKYSRAALRTRTVDLGQMAQEIVAQLAAASPGRRVDVLIGEDLKVQGDEGLLRAALENLLSNAWKYTSKNPESTIEFDAVTQPDGARVFHVRDNGAGFDMSQARNLFQPFQRLHTEDEFTGTGVGLATVQRIMQRHGGRIWVEAEVGKGATFFFELK